jgi:hypothetical protein
VIVGRRSLDPEVADAITILTIFTIRSYINHRQEKWQRKDPLYIVAEVLDSENLSHAREAGADEVIETSLLGFSLMSHSVFFRGSGQLLSRVAHPGSYSIYVGDLPEEIEPGAFSTVANALHANYNVMVIGVRGKPSEAVTLNPADDLPVADDMAIVYLGESPVLPTHELG